MLKKYPTSNKKAKKVVAIYINVILAVLFPIGVQPDKSKSGISKKPTKLDFNLFIMLSPLDMGCFFVSPHHPTPKPTLFTTLLSKKVYFPTLKLFESVATFNKIRDKI